MSNRRSPFVIWIAIDGEWAIWWIDWVETILSLEDALAFYQAQFDACVIDMSDEEIARISINDHAGQQQLLHLWARNP